MKPRLVLAAIAPPRSPRAAGASSSIPAAKKCASPGTATSAAATTPARSRSPCSIASDPVDRSGLKVSDELEIMARNEAAGMGADTIRPLGEPHDGAQSWGAYTCGSSCACRCAAMATRRRHRRRARRSRRIRSRNTERLQSLTASLHDARLRSWRRAPCPHRSARPHRPDRALASPTWIARSHSGATPSGSRSCSRRRTSRFSMSPACG